MSTREEYYRVVGMIDGRPQIYDTKNRDQAAEYARYLGKNRLSGPNRVTPITPHLHLPPPQPRNLEFITRYLMGVGLLALSVLVYFLL